MFLALPFDGGYTWTLVSRFGQMFSLAEDRYGERDRSYTFLGIEFSPDGPQLWYPNDVRNVVIQLSPECLNEPLRAHYQLAHECVHLLSPTGGWQVTVLEEGLATHFQHDYLRQHFDVDWYSPGMRSYDKARSLVEALLVIDANAIKNLREDQPKIQLIRSEAILVQYPELGKDNAVALTSPFVRDLSD
jgi:hypothetical protein